jgi:von Willebrand factor type A domain
LLQKEGSELEADKKQAAQTKHNTETQAARKGRFDGSSWNVPEGHRVTSQRDIRAVVRAHSGESNNSREHQYGRKLAQELRNLNEEARRPVTGLRRGRALDARRIPAAMAGRQDVMKNPGVSENQRCRVDVVVDRSCSVMWSEKNNQGQQVMAKMFGYMDQESRGMLPTSIYGYDGGGQVGHYAYKEAHSRDLRAIDGLASTGGGGTPTQDGIEFSRARLGRSKEKNKVMAVVTDGASNNQPATRAQIEAARREGIAVLGLAFECRASDMDEIFGVGNWAEIKNYQDAPRLVGKMISQLVRKNRRK